MILFIVFARSEMVFGNFTQKMLKRMSVIHALDFIYLTSNKNCIRVFEK